MNRLRPQFGARISTLALTATMALLTASPGRSQDATTGPDAQDGSLSKTELNEARARLRERDRATMHPGSPLTIVGVEQGDNDIRSRTPALMNSDFKPASVNLDDAYQRKLQMYETGARFGAPLAIASAASAPSAPRPVVEAVQPVIAEAPVMDKAASRQVLQWAVSILVAAGICLWGYKRFASRAEDVEAQS